MIVRWFGTRKSRYTGSSKNGKKASDTTSNVAAAEKELTEIVLFQCDRQMHARLIPMAAAVQFFVSIAWADALWLGKKAMADAERAKQLEEGFTDVSVSAFTFFDNWDYFLCGIVLPSPIILFLSQRYTTTRWIHELTLVKQGVRLTTYNLFGSKVTRVLPREAVTRVNKGIDVKGKFFYFHEKGEMDPEAKAVFTRVFKKKQ